jgi:hypothetical protein
VTLAAASIPSFRQLVAPSLHALRRVRVPFVLLLLCGLAFVVSYYHVPAVARVCESIAALKSRYGYGFSAVGGLCAGVIVPELFKRLTLRGHRLLPRLGEIVMDAPYFIFMAVLVDGLYRGLGVIFGTQVDVQTVVIKTLIDQFLFTPSLGVGIAATYFPLRKCGWDFRQIFAGFGPNWYVRTVMPILLPAWVFWIPAVALTYSLPPLLQMPFSLSATAAWSLLLVVIARQAVSTEVKIADPWQCEQ